MRQGGIPHHFFLRLAADRKTQEKRLRLSIVQIARAWMEMVRDSQGKSNFMN